MAYILGIKEIDLEKFCYQLWLLPRIKMLKVCTGHQVWDIMRSLHESDRLEDREQVSLKPYEEYLFKVSPPEVEGELKIITRFTEDKLGISPEPAVIDNLYNKELKLSARPLGRMKIASKKAFVTKPYVQNMELEYQSDRNEHLFHKAVLDIPALLTLFFGTNTKVCGVIKVDSLNHRDLFSAFKNYYEYHTSGNN